MRGWVMPPVPPPSLLFLKRRLTIIGISLKKELAGEFLEGELCRLSHLPPSSFSNAD